MNIRAASSAVSKVKNLISNLSPFFLSLDDRGSKNLLPHWDICRGGCLRIEVRVSLTTPGTYSSPSS